MLRPRGSKKAAQFTESVIREMTRLAHRHNAVNLSQGFPDFPAPDDIKEAACAAIRGDINQYAVTWGARELREAIAAQFSRRYGVPVDADEQVTVCCGSTETMMATLLATVDAGDEVIVFEPFYENYGPDAIVSGAVPRYVTLHEPDWSFDPDELAAAFGPKHARHHHQQPEQPDRQGVLARGADDDRAALPAVGRPGDHRRDLRAHRLRRPRARADGRDRRDGRSHGHDQRAVEDVQRHRLARGLGDLAAGGDRRDPQAARLPDRWRAGAAAAGGRGGAGVAGQLLHGAGGRLPQRAATCWSRSSRATGFRCFVPDGAYYVMTDISAFGFPDDVEFAKHLVEHVGVAAVPGSSFYRDAARGRTKLRFCFLEARRDDDRGRSAAGEAGLMARALGP